MAVRVGFSAIGFGFSGCCFSLLVVLRNMLIVNIAAGVGLRCLLWLVVDWLCCLLRLR